MFSTLRCELRSLDGSWLAQVCPGPGNRAESLLDVSAAATRSRSVRGRPCPPQYFYDSWGPDLGTEEKVTRPARIL